MTEAAQLPPQPTLSFSGFTIEHVNTILAGLRELPFKHSNDLIIGITNAAQAQINEFNAAIEAQQAQEPEVVAAE